MDLDIKLAILTYSYIFTPIPVSIFFFRYWKPQSLLVNILQCKRRDSLTLCQRGQNLPGIIFFRTQLPGYKKPMTPLFFQSKYKDTN